MTEWGPMAPQHLDAVEALADRVHPELPESRAVLAERLALFPAGCLVLERPEGIAGYAISHPIRRDEPPALDMLLLGLPVDASQYYIHDLVVAPEARGMGAAAAGVGRLLTVARAFTTTALVSVYGTAAFWARFGFRPSPDPVGDRLAPYGADAIFMVRDNLNETGIESTAGPNKRPPSA